MLRFEVLLLLFGFSGLVVFAIENGDDNNRDGGTSRNNCFVVATGTASCTAAVSLGSCSNNTLILKLAKTSLSALVCHDESTTPMSSTITLKLEGLYGGGVACFLAGSGNRTCDALYDDGTFAKVSSSDQTALQADLAAGKTSERVCCVTNLGSVTDFRDLGSLLIIAHLVDH